MLSPDCAVFNCLTCDDDNDWCECLCHRTEALFQMDGAP